jgi:hypothetical protein
MPMKCCGTDARGTGSTVTVASCAKHGDAAQTNEYKQFLQDALFCMDESLAPLCA